MQLSTASHLSLFGFTAVETGCSASDLSVKALMLLRCEQAESRAPTWQMYAEGVKQSGLLWSYFRQNKTADTFTYTQSFSKLQPSSKSDYHRSIMRLAARSGSTLIEGEPSQSAHLCFLCNRRASARSWCLLIFNFDVNSRLRRNLQNHCHRMHTTKAKTLRAGF